MAAMEFFKDVVTSTLKGTLTIPEPLPEITATSTHKHHHHHGPTPLPPSPPMEPLPRSQNHFQHIDKTGETALMVFTVLFGVALIITFALSKRVERKLRLFHNITGVIIATAFISYMCMAFGLGKAYVPSYKNSGEDSKIHLYREVFYARYIDWAITTPLLLLDLALLAGLPLTTTILAMMADLAMIVTGLIGGLSRSGEKARWSFFVLSNIFYLYVLFTLLVSGRAAAKLQSGGVQRVYLICMLMTVILWTGYPIVFALTEGKGIISVDAEVIVYGILDVFAKIVFGMYLLLAHSHTEGDSVVISEFWTEPRGKRTGNYGAISQDD